MLALSINQNYINFLSIYKSANQLYFEDYHSFKIKKNHFNQEFIEKIKERKKIKKSKHISRKCMFFLESNEVFLNQFKCPDEVKIETFIDWYKNLTFGKKSLNEYSDYHYEISEQIFLSLYIEKQKQSHYYNCCYKAGLNLHVLSLGILSANYLARLQFDANNQNSYMVWGVGNDSINDEILIVKDGMLNSIISIDRQSDFSLINYTGSKDTVENTLKMLKEKMKSDLKEFNIVDKIYMYQKCPNSDMKKIYNKKNKDSIIVLNPLLKMANSKKNKINIVESSYLAEMGYIFKTISND